MKEIDGLTEDIERRWVWLRLVIIVLSVIFLVKYDSLMFAGVFGFFLADWTESSLRSIRLKYEKDI